MHCCTLHPVHCCNRADIYQVIDFGLCAEMKDGVTSRAFVGTVLYTAPEILKVDGLNVACDLWSLGVMAFALVSGQFPWYSDSKDVCGQMIKYSPLQFPKEVSGPFDPLNLCLKSGRYIPG